MNNIHGRHYANSGFSQSLSRQRSSSETVIDQGVDPLQEAYTQASAWQPGGFQSVHSQQTIEPRASTSTYNLHQIAQQNSNQVRSPMQQDTRCDRWQLSQRAAFEPGLSRQNIGARARSAYNLHQMGQDVGDYTNNIPRALVSTVNAAALKSTASELSNIEGATTKNGLKRYGWLNEMTLNAYDTASPKALIMKLRNELSTGSSIPTQVLQLFKKQADPKAHIVPEILVLVSALGKREACGIPNEKYAEAFVDHLAEFISTHSNVLHKALTSKNGHAPDRYLSYSIESFPKFDNTTGQTYLAFKLTVNSVKDMSGGQPATCSALLTEETMWNIFNTVSGYAKTHYFLQKFSDTCGHALTRGVEKINQTQQTTRIVELQDRLKKEVILSRQERMENRERAIAQEEYIQSRIQKEVQLGVTHAMKSLTSRLALPENTLLDEDQLSYRANNMGADRPRQQMDMWGGSLPHSTAFVPPHSSSPLSDDTYPLLPQQIQPNNFRNPAITPRGLFSPQNSNSSSAFRPISTAPCVLNNTGTPQGTTLDQLSNIVEQLLSLPKNRPSPSSSGRS